MLPLLLALAPPGVLGAASLLASHYDGNLYSLALSDAGDLSVTGRVATGARMPSWLTFDRENRTVYCTDEFSYGRPVLAAFDVAEDGTATKKAEAQTPGGELHSCLFGGEDGKGFIAMAEYDQSSIITMKLPISTSSSVLQSLKYTLSRPGPNSRQNAPHPHSTFADPSGKYLLSADLGADLVRIFSIDSAGKLTECPPAAASPGDGPRHGAFWSPADAASDSDLTTLYTVNELGNSVTSWAVTYPAGSCMTLAKKQTLSTLPPGKNPPPGAKAAEVHVRDNSLYAANRFDKSFGPTEDSLATYEIDPATGAISFVETTSAHAYFPRTFEINARGDMVAVGGQTSATVAILERNVTTGRLGGLVASVRVGAMGRENQEDGLSHVIWNE